MLESACGTRLPRDCSPAPSVATKNTGRGATTSGTYLSCHEDVSPHSPVIEKIWKYDPYTSDMDGTTGQKGPRGTERLEDPASIDAQVVVIDDHL